MTISPELTARIEEIADRESGGTISQPWLVRVLSDLAEPLHKEMESIKATNVRDGNWIDQHGCCKVCDGELPHGHTGNCDIYKLEQEITLLKAELSDTEASRQEYIRLFHEQERENDALEAQLAEAKKAAEEPPKAAKEYE